MPYPGPKFHHGDMSAATIHPAPSRPPGATALDGVPHSQHRLGDALRAVKVFVGAAALWPLLAIWINWRLRRHVKR